MSTSVEQSVVIEEIRDVFGEDSTEATVAEIIERERLNSRELPVVASDRTGVSFSEASQAMRGLAEGEFIELKPGQPVQLIDPPTS